MGRREGDAREIQPRSDFSNFDYIRLVAASAVIFSHSFLLADGHEGNEPFVRLLGEKNILGLYGVFTFFVISGFLITQSACASRSVGAFAWSRVLRIYPALICCAAFCGIVLRSIFTTVPLTDYWIRLLPLDYAASASLLPGTEGWSIPTVIFYSRGSWLADGMNGSFVQALDRKPWETHVWMKAKSRFPGAERPAATDFGDRQSPCRQSWIAHGRAWAQDRPRKPVIRWMSD